jgi:hypothetical protein
VNAIEHYLETLNIGAYTSMAGLAIGLVCLVMLGIVISDLAKIKQALGAGPPPARHHAGQPYSGAPYPPR